MRVSQIVWVTACELPCDLPARNFRNTKASSNGKTRLLSGEAQKLLSHIFGCQKQGFQRNSSVQCAPRAVSSWVVVSKLYLKDNKHNRSVSPAGTMASSLVEIEACVEPEVLARIFRFKLQRELSNVNISKLLGKRTVFKSVSLVSIWRLLAGHMTM